MQSHYSSQAPATGSYYAAPGAQQPPLPYAMWPGQPMVPYGAPPGTPFYPGGIFAPPPGHSSAYPYGSATAASTGAPGEGAGDGANANGKANGNKGADPTGAGLVEQSQMMSHLDTQQAQGVPPQHPGVVVDPSQQYWQHPSAAMAGAGPVPGQHPGAEMWLQGGQDERELKRQRRKQSNRESARRSRLRKQAECEDLGKRVDRLQDENKLLREEIARLTAAVSTVTEDRGTLEEQLRGLGSEPKVEVKTEEETVKVEEEAK